MRIQTAFSLGRDAVWAVANGYGYHVFYNDFSSIERARNSAIKTARKQGWDYMVLQDSDCYVTPEAVNHGLLASCMEALDVMDAAVCGVAFACRHGRSMNCEPSIPGKVYPGRVGTGYMVMDMSKLSELPLPWFEFHLNDERTETVMGEDLAFCKLVEDHKQKVVVNYSIPTGHGIEYSIDVPATEVDESEKAA